jgi:hypothetical protein
MLERKMHIAHMERLRAGNEESRATTTVHVDAVSDLKRIVTHAARIAYAVLGKVHERPQEMDAECAPAVEAGAEAVIEPAGPSRSEAAPGLGAVSASGPRHAEVGRPSGRDARGRGPDHL